MRFIKSLLILFSTGYLILFGISAVIANSTGSAGYSSNPSHNNGMNCSTAAGCHTGGIPPTVTFQGPKKVKAGSKNQFKLTMRNGQDQFGGVNISADSGTLFSKDSFSTGIAATVAAGSDFEIIHIAPQKVLTDGTTVTWIFDWIAPDVLSEGTPSIIYAALLSSDGDKTEAGDSTKVIPIEVNVVTDAELPVGDIKPKAIITAPFTAALNVKVPLIASQSTVDGGFIASYKWSFSGSSDVSDQEQLERAFNKLGVNTVTLDVTSNKGITSRTFFDIYVTSKITNTTSELVPLANISAPNIGVVDVPVTFTGNTSPSTISRYIWDFGDGVTTNPNPEPSITHTFTQANTYTVTLAVKGKNELTNIDVFEIVIGDGVAVAQDIITGEQLYTNTDVNPVDTDCTGGGCHGIGGIANGAVKDIRGATKLLIDDSIAGVNNVPIAMMTKIDNIKSIDANGTQKVANYLAQVVFPTTPVPTDLDKGRILYETRCLICHGVAADGVGTRGRNIQGAGQTTILDAIAQVVSVSPPKNAIPLMKDINLSAPEASLIQGYLTTLLPATGNLLLGESTFNTRCSLCHGTGTGGLASNIQNTTVVNVNTGLTSQPAMQNIKVNTVDIQNIVSFLASKTLVLPVTDKGLYDMYCSYCHGLDARGGNIAEKSLQGNNWSGQDIMDAYSNGGIDVMINTKLSLVPELSITVLDRIANYINQLGNGE